MNISIRRQIYNNAVAQISIAIAVGALAYNTWRNETTEEQRNVRHAAFRVLEDLGEVQEVVDSRYYYLAFRPCWRSFEAWSKIAQHENYRDATAQPASPV